MLSKYAFSRYWWSTYIKDGIRKAAGSQFFPSFTRGYFLLRRNNRVMSLSTTLPSCVPLFQTEFRSQGAFKEGIKRSQLLLREGLNSSAFVMLSSNEAVEQAPNRHLQRHQCP